MAYIPSNCSIEEYEEQIYSGESKHKLYIKHGNTIIGTNGDDNASPFCSSLVWKRRLLANGSKSFSLDNFISQEIDLVLHDYQITNLEEELEIKIATFVDSINDYVYVPLGYYKIQDNPTTNNGKTTFKLRDRSVNFDFNYNGKTLIDDNGGAVTKQQILLDICNQANVEYVGNLEFNGFNDLIGTYDSTITARTYISYLAEASGCIAVINRDGKLDFIEISTDKLIEKEINPEIVEKFEDGNDFLISKVVYESGEVKYEYGGLHSTSGELIEINDGIEGNIKQLIIEGKSTQEKYKGKNLLMGDGYSTPRTNASYWKKLASYVTPEKDGYCHVVCDNTAGTGYKFVNIHINSTQIVDNIKASTNYRAVWEITNSTSNGSVLFQLNTYDGDTSSKKITDKIMSGYGVGNGTRSVPFTTVSDLSTANMIFRTYFRVDPGASVDCKIRLMIVAENETDYTYEKYVGATSSPNPKFPQEIKSIDGITNLFDKNNFNFVYGYISASEKKFVLANDDKINKILYIPCEPNTTYRIKKIADKKFRVATSTEIPTNNELCSSFIGNDTDKELIITSKDNDKYLSVFYISTAETYYTEQEVLDSINIEYCNNNLLDSSLFEEFTTDLKFINLQLTPNTTYKMSSNYLGNKSGTYGNLFFYNTNGYSETGISDISSGISRIITTDADGIARIAYRDVDDEYSNETTNYWYFVEETSVDNGHHILKIESSNKNNNLLDMPYDENYKLTNVAKNNDYYQMLNYYAYLEANKKYTFSVEVDGTFPGDGTTGSKQQEVYLCLDKAYSTTIYMGSKEFTFTPPKSGNYYIRYDINKQGEMHSFWNFKIEEGEKKTPYIKSKSNFMSINLGGYEVCSLSNEIKDTIKITNNEILLTKKIGKIILNGTEDWGHTENRYYINLDGLKDEKYYKNISTHFHENLNNSSHNADNFSLMIYKNTAWEKGRLSISYANITSADFKKWLSNNNVIVYYELEEPINVPLGNTNSNYIDYNLFSLNTGLEDTLRIENNRMILTKRVGKIILNGSEQITRANTYDSHYRYEIATTETNIKLPKDNNTVPNINSNYFTRCTVNQTWGAANYDNALIGISLNSSLSSKTGGGAFLIKYESEDTKTLDLFKDWLSKNNITIYYELETPYEIDLGDMNMLKIYEGYSKITNNDLANMLLTYYFDVGEDNNLYINSANPFIKDENTLENIYNSINDFDINSFSTGKILGNPTFDPYDILKITYKDKTYRTLAQYTLSFKGTMINTFDTKIEYEQRKTNVSKNGNANFKKTINSHFDNIEATLVTTVEKVNETTEQLTQVITSINDIKNLFQITGGRNLIKNSVGLFGNQSWEESETGTFEYGEDNDLIGITTSMSKIKITNGTLTTTNDNIVSLTLNETKSLSYKVKQDENVITTIKLYSLDENKPIYQKTFNEKIEEWTEIYDDKLNKFYIDSPNLILKIESTGEYDGSFYISDLMLNNGDKSVWELSSGEIWGAVIKLSQLGIQVYGIEGNYVTIMSTQGLQTRQLNGQSIGDVITEFTKNGLLTIDIEQSGKHIQKNLIHTIINSNGREIYIEYIKDVD